MDLLAEFEEKKVKQIHFNVEYMALNFIHSEINNEPNYEPNNEPLAQQPEQDPEPNNQPNQPISQSNQPNQPTSDPLYKRLINDLEAALTQNLTMMKKAAVSLVQNCRNLKMMRM
ncbi:hypothetical protein ACOSQ3_006692 [Xanthoceras sorbifolium]